MDNAIVAGLLSIVAALIGGLITIYVHRRKARRDSGQQLIAEFAALKAAFNEIASSKIEVIEPTLTKAFPRLETQINIFERHLYRWEKRGFRRAWIDYYNAYGDDSGQCYHHYLPFKTEGYVYGKQVYMNDNTKTYMSNFNNNIEKILKYARQG